MVQIVTTLVIECLRAACNKNALKYAYVLMKPEHRDKIDVKFKKKIEVLVRKSPGMQYTEEELQEELEIDSYPCPYCDEKVREDEFTCYGCRNAIPFCIASSMHIDLPQLSKCPHCTFPANKASFVKLLSFENVCPMCNTSVDVTNVETVASIHDTFDMVSGSNCK